MAKPTLNQQISAARNLRLEAKRLVREAKAAKLLADRAQQELYDRMEAEDTQSHKYRGRNYSAAATVYGNVNDRSELERWAIDEGNAPWLFNPKPGAKQVNEYVRQCLDNNEPLPPGLDFYVREYVSGLGGEGDDE